MTKSSEAVVVDTAVRVDAGFPFLVVGVAYITFTAAALVKAHLVWTARLQHAWAQGPPEVLTLVFVHSQLVIAAVSDKHRILVFWCNWATEDKMIRVIMYLDMLLHPFNINISHGA